MAEKVLVKVDNVSKKFCKDLKTSLWYGMKDLGSEFLGLKSKKTLRNKEFWSVKDVSFELRRGECLGLIGHNGAGKSTLLKMLNGLIKPDKGKISMYGRVGALIELGAGFNPLLTGRENVYINGQILGFSKREIDQKFEAIIDFAELGDFIDAPVQNYSSGMKVRLGFAVAAQMEPDVLIIDEVLAVGDAGFRAKCFNAISKISQNSAVIFVTHSMPLLTRICDRVLVLDKGKKIFDGSDFSEGTNIYFSLTNTSRAFKQEIGSGKVKIDPAENNFNNEIISYGSPFEFQIRYQIDEIIRNYVVYISLVDQELKAIAQSFSFQNNKEFQNDGSKQTLRLQIPSLQLTNGVYSVSIGFFEKDFSGENIGRFDNISSFKIKGTPINGFAPFMLEGEWSVTQV